MDNLEDIITASLEDAELTPEPTEEPTETLEDDLQSVEEPTTTASETTEELEPESTPTESEEASPEVKSPSAKATEPVKGDDFEKKFGIAAQSASGRENRIPYSRVTKIVSKAQKEAQELIRKEFEPKVTEYETKVKDYETKLANYDARWVDVDKFEKVMLNDQGQFLDMLAKIPAYQPFFAKVNELFLKEQSGTTTPTPTEPVSTVPVDMPQPDSEDGSTYTKEGLQKLLQWNANQAATLAEERVTKRYAPMETQFQAHERMQIILPKVQDQITEARKLPMFNESEQEIVSALQADKTLTLEGAYNKVVVPKLVAAREAATTDRATIEKETREKVLEELKKAPSSTSARTTPSKAAPTSSGPRSIEDIIAESVKTAKAAGLK